MIPNYSGIIARSELLFTDVNFSSSFGERGYLSKVTPVLNSIKAPGGSFKTDLNLTQIWVKLT